MSQLFIARLSPRQFKRGRPRGTLLPASAESSFGLENEDHSRFFDLFTTDQTVNEAILEFGQPPMPRPQIGDLVIGIIGSEDPGGATNARGLYALGEIKRVIKDEGEGNTARVGLLICFESKLSEPIDTDRLQLSQHLGKSGLRENKMLGFDGHSQAQNFVRLYGPEVNQSQKLPWLRKLLEEHGLDCMKFTASFPNTDWSLPNVITIKPGSKGNDAMHRLREAVAAKPFVIIAGGSGTGKTRAAQLVAESIAGKDNVEVVAVGADWTDNRPLLGFRNLLAEGGKNYVAPPALRIILKALDNPGKPHFLILDEMNLSHVERYFADFLSSMESKEPLKLHDSAEDLQTEDGILVKGKVEWPGNLFVIGTVNIDETTYMFSPKVLDRAHVIEFKVPWEEIEAGLDDAVPGELTPLTEPQIAEFMRVATLKDKTLTDDEHAALVEVLGDMHEALDGTRFVFAHRTARECLNFIASAKALAAAGIVPGQDTKALIDLAILQKALPKLNGAAGTLSKVLDDLIKVADNHDLDQCKAKLESMSRQLKADQFVSFIQ